MRLYGKKQTAQNDNLTYLENNTKLYSTTLRLTFTPSIRHTEIHDQNSLKAYSYHDNQGQFTTVAIVARGSQKYPGRKEFKFRGITDQWLYKKEVLEQWWQKGLIYTSKRGGYRKKQYLKDSPGIIVSDLFIDDEVKPLQGKNSESTGYPTQKPLALLLRILQASSGPGDIVLDPFCGCATTCVAAEKLGRKWIGIDVSDKAYDLVKLRLDKEVSSDMWHGQVTFRKDIPIPTKEQTRPKLDDRHHLFGKQLGRCNGCKTRFDHFRHFHLDHIVPKARGGSDHITNYQLLCGSCNAIKGKHDMPYLLARLKERGILPQTV